MKTLIKPPKLEPGDTIGLVSPSAPLAGLVTHRVKKAIQMLEELGFKVKIGVKVRLDSSKNLFEIKESGAY